ncbi:MAG: hypothetical protein DMG27_00295 [Acidobacteria bacterium]|nr:MAG: hypothetical protein DMG27_00295 [Acidobacteriota bacterium]
MFSPPTKTESSPAEFVTSILRGPRGADALTEMSTATQGTLVVPLVQLGKLDAGGWVTVMPL